LVKYSRHACYGGWRLWITPSDIAFRHRITKNKTKSNAIFFRQWRNRCSLRARALGTWTLNRYTRNHVFFYSGGCPVSPALMVAYNWQAGQRVMVNQDTYNGFQLVTKLHRPQYGWADYVPRRKL